MLAYVDSFCLRLFDSVGSYTMKSVKGSVIIYGGGVVSGGVGELFERTFLEYQALI